MTIGPPAFNLTAEGDMAGLDWIIERLPGSNPCGPDLAAIEDSEFADYFYEATSRLPEDYVRLDRSNDGAKLSPFPANQVDTKAEAGRILPLLRRSRDLRLLALLAQWEALAGQLGPLTDALEGAADLLEAFGDEVHPRVDGSTRERREAIEEFARGATIVQPLLHMPLTRLGDGVSVRKLAVAGGEERPRGYEVDMVGRDLAAVLASREARRDTTAAQADLLRLDAAADRIETVCATHPTRPFSPALAPLRDAARRALDAIAAAHPDLAPLSFSPSLPATAQKATLDAPVAEATPAVPVPVWAVPLDHGDACDLLASSERYLMAYEPSSAALIVVRQARQLIGKTFVEALDLLMPQDAARATIGFGPAAAFTIPIDRMRSLSSHDPAGEPEGSLTPLRPIESRGDVAVVIMEVAAYFDVREPSSPVPLLLRRAETLLNARFESLVTELISRDGA